MRCSTTSSPSRRSQGDQRGVQQKNHDIRNKTDGHNPPRTTTVDVTATPASGTHELLMGFGLFALLLSTLSASVEPSVTADGLQRSTAGSSAPDSHFFYTASTASNDNNDNGFHCCDDSGFDPTSFSEFLRSSFRERFGNEDSYRHFYQQYQQEEGCGDFNCGAGRFSGGSSFGDSSSSNTKCPRRLRNRKGSDDEDEDDAATTSSSSNGLLPFVSGSDVSHQEETDTASCTTPQSFSNEALTVIAASLTPSRACTPVDCSCSLAALPAAALVSSAAESLSMVLFQDQGLDADWLKAEGLNVPCLHHCTLSTQRFLRAAATGLLQLPQKEQEALRSGARVVCIPYSPSAVICLTGAARRSTPSDTPSTSAPHEDAGLSSSSSHTPGNAETSSPSAAATTTTTTVLFKKCSECRLPTTTPDDGETDTGIQTTAPPLRCENCVKQNPTGTLYRIFFGQLRKDTTPHFVQWLLELLGVPADEVALIEMHTARQGQRAKGCAWVDVRTVSSLERILEFNKRIFLNDSSMFLNVVDANNHNLKLARGGSTEEEEEEEMLVIVPKEGREWLQNASAVWAQQPSRNSAALSRGPIVMERPQEVSVAVDEGAAKTVGKKAQRSATATTSSDASLARVADVLDDAQATAPSSAMKKKKVSNKKPKETSNPNPAATIPLPSDVPTPADSTPVVSIQSPRQQKKAFFSAVASDSVDAAPMAQHLYTAGVKATSYFTPRPRPDFFYPSLHSHGHQNHHGGYYRGASFPQTSTDEMVPSPSRWRHDPYESLTGKRFLLNDADRSSCSMFSATE